MNTTFLALINYGCHGIVAYARSLVSQGAKFYTQDLEVEEEEEEEGVVTTPTVRLDKSNILLLGPTGCGAFPMLVYTFLL